MGNVLSAWAKCPECGSQFIFTEFPSKRGVKLHCYGTDANPHPRVRVYRDADKAVAASIPQPAEVVEMPRKSRSRDLLERAARLAA